MTLFATILLLILAVSLSGVLAGLFPFKMPLPLVQIGLGIFLACIGTKMELEPELFMLLFIPPLLFEDGRKTKLTNFIKRIREIIGLALVLVLLTVIGIGYLLYWLVPNISLPAAFALAAVLSPTDAVALGGIVGHGKIEKTKLEILEGESLMNDASGLVSFKFAILVAVGALEFNLFNASLSFVIVAIGGLAIGVIVTWLYSKLLAMVNEWNNNEPTTQIALYCLLPFIAYLTAEHMGTSGILAAVSAGMTVTQTGLIRTASLTARLQSYSTWSMLTFLFNGFVFLILGLQIPKILSDTFYEVSKDASIELWQLYSIVIIVYLALMAMRFGWLLSIKKISQKLRFNKRPSVFVNYSTKDLLISTFAGVRGAITLAAVLSVPISIQGRYELVFIAAGVILVSLFVSVIALPLLLRNAEVVDKLTLAEEEKFARQTMREDAIKSLENIQDRIENATQKDLNDTITSDISIRLISELRNDPETERSTEEHERRLRLIAVGAERASIYKLKATGKISINTAEKLLYELDVRESVLTKKTN